MLEDAGKQQGESSGAPLSGCRLLEHAQRSMDELISSTAQSLSVGHPNKGAHHAKVGAAMQRQKVGHETTPIVL